jgi:hypothetical protein
MQYRVQETTISHCHSAFKRCSGIARVTGRDIGNLVATKENATCTNGAGATFVAE